MSYLKTLNKAAFALNTTNRPVLLGLFFGCLALILFHPFLFGKFALGGTDVIFGHYPNLLFGYREFQKFGAFSLWNRYIFDGVDFSQSMHAHYLNPLYWPLLLFPEKYIFQALTAMLMVINALTGWFWSRIATRLGVLQIGSVIVGVVAQAGMFFWFAMTTLIAVPMSLFATIVIYVILSRYTRSNLANYIMLSLALGLLFVTPHPAYILGFSLPIITVFLSSVYPGWLYRPWRGFSAIFVAAGITALLLAAYRIVPVARELALNGNLFSNMWDQRLPYDKSTYAYFGLTAFNPSSLGLHIGYASYLSSILGFNAHNQFHNALYFGVAPLVLVYFSARSSGGSKFILPLAVVYLILQQQVLYVFQPLIDIINTLLFPFIHGAIFRLSTYFAFLFLLIYCVKRFLDIDRSLFAKLIREFVLLTGLVLMAGIVLYSIWMHSSTELVTIFGNKNITNFFRIVLLLVLSLTFYVSTFSIERFRSITLIVYSLIVFSLVLGIIIAYLVLDIIPGSESLANSLKNSLAVLLVCVSVLFSLNDVERKARKTIIARFSQGIALVLLIIPTSWFSPYLSEKADLTFALSTVVSWGVFIALVAVSVHLLARFASGEIKKNRFMTSMLVLILVDLVAAFGAYSYVNVPLSPFVRHIEDIYPSTTLLMRAANIEADLKEQGNRPNLITNPEFQFVSGSPKNWSLGGVNLSLCSPALDDIKRQQTNGICVYYPSADGGGNLYQDITLPAGINRVAAGVWIRAPRGMSAGLFITSPSNGTPLIKFEGADRWHWINVALQSPDPIKNIRVHINLSKAGHIEIYAPRLISGAVVRPVIRPRGDYAIDEIKAELPAIDLASYRVNHVTAINGYAENEIMANYAIVAGTPTYAGVDSDFPSDFVDFLKVFRKLDPSWYHRAGLLSSFEDARFLDLQGVAYDTNALQGVIRRPNAIPRFAAFSDYEVLDQQTGLLRLKDPSFDPAKTLVLGSRPADSPSAISAGRFLRLDYLTPKADHLSLKITDEMPRIILFNDRFSPHWQAYWNGNPLQIVRANSLFMAVSVPDGTGELSFIFRPQLFIRLATVSAMVVGLLLSVGIAGFFWPKCFRAYSRLPYSAKR